MNMKLNSLTTKSNVLTDDHIVHLEKEGFTIAQIDQLIKWGVKSLTEAEAIKLNIIAKDDSNQYVSSSGLYFPFTSSFGQMRCDYAPMRKGKPAKYLIPRGKKSEAWLPEGCIVITEGFKDAVAGTLHGGIPTGALAGVSHYRKALKEGEKYIVLFDSDGWVNHSVFLNLFNAGLYLKGKVLILPRIPNEPKGGLCEWFKHLTQENKDKQLEYRNLINSALKPTTLLLEWGKHIGDINDDTKQYEAIRVALNLAVKHLKSLEIDSLINNIAKSTSINKRSLNKELAQQRIKVAATKDKSFSGAKSLVRYTLKGDAKLLSDSTIANILAEEWRSILAYNDEDASFYRYEADERKGIWSKESKVSVQNTVQAELDARGASGLYSIVNVNGIIDLLKGSVLKKQWDEAKDLIPLKNGVLNLRTMQLSEHAPGNQFTWQLPYDYDPSATCEPIKQWLLSTQDGDESRVQLLRAYLKAIVTGRSDLQRYIECIGGGGSGKSTFANLAMSLIGQRNVKVSTLREIETNRFETASLRDKRLLYITDSDKYGQGLSIFKAITGGDPVRNEEKNKQQRNSFIPRVMVLVVANEIIQSTDYTSGLERRRITVPFEKTVPLTQQRDLLTISNAEPTGEFVPFIPGLLNWVLAMPDVEMKELVKNTALKVPSLSRYKFESLLKTNPLAAWLDEHCVLLDDAKTYIGVEKKIKETKNEGDKTISRDQYEKSNEWLYANYCEYCVQSGGKPVSNRRFAELLIDLVNNQLRLTMIKSRDSKGSYLKGIALRALAHKHIPSPVTNTVMDNNVTMTAETTDSDGSDGYDSFFDTESNKKTKYPEYQPKKINTIYPHDYRENPSYPSDPSPPGISAIDKTSLITGDPSQQKIKRGDLVMLNLDLNQVDVESLGIPAGVVFEVVGVIHHINGKVEIEVKLPEGNIKPLDASYLTLLEATVC